MMVTFGWLNSYTVLIVPFAASAFGIFLARQYALAIPMKLRHNIDERFGHAIMAST